MEANTMGNLRVAAFLAVLSLGLLLTTAPAATARSDEPLGTIEDLVKQLPPLPCQGLQTPVGGFSVGCG